MEVNQDLTTPEEDVLEDTEDQVETEIQETTEVEEEKDMGIETAEAVATATADVADGSTVKLKGLNFIN
jgi:hypothetical protein